MRFVRVYFVTSLFLTSRYGENMKMRVVLSIAFVMAGALSAPSAAWAAVCLNTGAPVVAMRIVDPQPRVIYKALSQINAAAQSHGLVRRNSRVLGTTQSSIRSSLGMRFIVARRGTETCLSVSRINIRFGYSKLTVLLPREYPRGSCKQTVVRRHEMAHVSVNRRTLRRYAAIMKVAIQRAARTIGSVQTRNVARTQKRIQSRMQNVIVALTERFQRRVNTLQAVIDAPGSPYDAAGTCKGW